MSLENRLKTKTYYETLLETNSKVHPLLQLGHQFLDEQQKEMPDASYIRFSQGELYYHHKDYEAAIFKWNNVHNELSAWAKKNCGDAYMEMELFSAAEEVYTSIETDSVILKTEIMLNLFKLYIQQGKRDKADDVIKQLVLLNPDDSRVTREAKAFFEEEKDWESAITLCIREGIRQESPYWFEVLKKYIREGYGKGMEPSKFLDAIEALYKFDLPLLESFILALKENYQNGEYYFNWIKMMNQFLLKEKEKKDYRWHELENMYRRLYEELMANSFSLQELSEVIPDVLAVWLKLSEGSNGVLPASAIFAWNEAVPQIMGPEILKRAEKVIFSEKANLQISEKVQELYNSVMTWTKDKKLSVSARLKSIEQHLLDYNTHYVAIAGVNGKVKQQFVRSFLQENLPLQEKAGKSILLYKFSNHLMVNEITDEESREFNDIENYYKRTKNNDPREVFYEIQLPNSLLKKYKLSFIDLPDFSLVPVEKLENYIRLADSFLFIFPEDFEPTEKERSIIDYLQTVFPFLPVDFIGYQRNGKNGKNEKQKGVWKYDNHSRSREELASFLSARTKDSKLERNRMKKYLDFIRGITQSLLAQRAEMENYVMEKIQEREDLYARLKGAIHQLEDMEVEKAKQLSHLFHKVKEDTKKEIMDNIPEVIKKWGNTIPDDLENHDIDQKLNEEMNQWIEQYMNGKIFPKFQERITEWLDIAEKELNKANQFFRELSKGFNDMLGHQILQLEGDFKIIEDWRRDIERLKYRIVLGQENLFHYLSPSQVIMINTGKVWSTFGKKQKGLGKKYKNIIEKGNYKGLAGSLAEKMLAPFILLEQGIERDLSLYFKAPFENMEKLKKDIEREKTSLKEELNTLKDHPVTFRDPLYLFQILILQYKYILEAEELSDEVPL